MKFDETPISVSSSVYVRLVLVQYSTRTTRFESEDPVFFNLIHQTREMFVRAGE